MTTIPVSELVRYAASRKPQNVPPSSLWSHGHDLTRWNTHGGSQNISPVAHAASGDWRWLVALARCWHAEGLWGRELGAPGFYFDGPVAAMILALRDARAAGDRDAVADLEMALEAVWAWEALTAVPWPRSSSLAVFGRPEGQQEVAGPGNADWYDGISCATAGDRWNLRSTEEGKPGGYPDQDPHAWWLAWALDWRPRHDRHPSAGKLRRQDVAPENAVAHVAGVDSYDQATSPEVFGLSAASRQQLHAFIASAGRDEQAFAAVLGMVARMPPRQRYRRTIRRTTEGVEHAAWNARNGNKPTLAIAIVERGGRWIGVRPCRHRGTGANKGLVVEDAGGGVLRFGCGEGERATLHRLGGEEVWRVEFDDGRLEIHRGGPGAVGPPPPPGPRLPEPPEPPAPPRPAPSPTRPSKEPPMPPDRPEPSIQPDLGTMLSPRRWLLHVTDPATTDPHVLVVETRGPGKLVAVREHRDGEAPQ